VRRTGITKKAQNVYALKEGIAFPRTIATGRALQATAGFAGGQGLSCHVLALNRHYMPIRITTVRRAFSLLYRGLAEVVHIEDGQYLSYDFAGWRELSDFKCQFEPEEHDWVRTVRFSLAVPRIIRLTIYERLPANTVRLSRRNIFARDGSRCQYCGEKFSTSELSLDHVIPRSQNGKTTWENLVCCCLACNIKKGGRTPEQAHMNLITKPVKPRRSPAINIQLSKDRYRSWKQFLDHAYWNVELK